MRLIDADAVRDELFVDFFDSDDWGFISRHIDDAPTIDAVSIVRCNECKFCNAWSDKETHCIMLGRWTSPDFYCANGARRQ